MHFRGEARSVPQCSPERLLRRGTEQSVVKLRLDIREKNLDWHTFYLVFSLRAEHLHISKEH